MSGQLNNRTKMLVIRDGEGGGREVAVLRVLTDCGIATHDDPCVTCDVVQLCDAKSCYAFVTA